jgi:hypothetical protein
LVVSFKGRHGLNELLPQDGSDGEIMDHGPTGPEVVDVDLELLQFEKDGSDGVRSLLAAGLQLLEMFLTVRHDRQLNQPEESNRGGTMSADRLIYLQALRTRPFWPHLSP